LCKIGSDNNTGMDRSSGFTYGKNGTHTLFFPQRSLTSTKNRTVGSSLEVRSFSFPRTKQFWLSKNPNGGFPETYLAISHDERDLTNSKGRVRLETHPRLTVIDDHDDISCNRMWWIIVYYESIKRETKRRLIHEYGCDERLKTKNEESTHLSDTGLVVELEQLKTKTRLKVPLSRMFPTLDLSKEEKPWDGIGRIQDLITLTELLKIQKNGQFQLSRRD
jgi:hypothetical protein